MLCRPWRASSGGIKAQSPLRVQVTAAWGLHQVPLGVLGTSPETEPLPQAPRGPLSTPDGTKHRQEKTWPGHLSP